MFGLELANQYIIFAKSAGVGFLCAFFYSVFASSDLNNKFLKAVTDFFSLIFCGTVSFLFCYEINFGIMRSYILAGEVCGWIIYYLTVRKTNKRIGKRIKKYFKSRKNSCIK